MAQASLELAVELRLRRFRSRNSIVGELRSSGVSEGEAAELVRDIWERIRDDLALETLRNLARNLVFMTMCAFMTYFLAANPVETDQISLVLVGLVIFGFLVAVFTLTVLIQMARLVATRT